MSELAVNVATRANAGATPQLTRWAFLLMAGSGCAALGYQIVWTQQCGLWLGHETPAVLAVVAAFFGGCSVGALLFGARIDASRRPLRWYLGCEAVIGCWSLALAFLMPPVSTLMLDVIGPQPSAAWHWSVVFCGTFLLLLPATAAMGATMPAMERILGTWRASGGPIAILYAGNTVGAVVGVLGAAFLFVPRFGLFSTALICVSVNFCCAVLALRVFPSNCKVPARRAASERRHHLGALAATGFLGIGVEVLVVRVLSQVAENTVYTFAIVLAAYLVGTALGAAFYDRWGHGKADDRLRDRLLQLLTGACLLSVLCLTGAVGFKSLILHILGGSMPAALTAEALLALGAFLPPTIVMGALFSHLASMARESGVTLGLAFGVNTLGAAFAPLACGLLLCRGSVRGSHC